MQGGRSSPGRTLSGANGPVGCPGGWGGVREEWGGSGWALVGGVEYVGRWQRAVVEEDGEQPSSTLEAAAEAAG